VLHLGPESLHNQCNGTIRSRTFMNQVVKPETWKDGWGTSFSSNLGSYLTRTVCTPSVRSGMRVEVASEREWFAVML
jgi:hypothetical protein